MRKIEKYFFLFLYYGFAQYLPDSYLPVLGSFANSIRIFCVRHIFKKCGKVSNINRRAYFGNGAEVEIDDYSSIGAGNQLPNDIKIGRYCMLAPNIVIFRENHNITDTETPMCFQGKTAKPSVIIEDDVWIGQNVMVMAGCRIKKGSVLAAGSVVTKEFPEYSIVGGNPAKLIKSRKV